MTQPHLWRGAEYIEDIEELQAIVSGHAPIQAERLPQAESQRSISPRQPVQSQSASSSSTATSTATNNSMKPSSTAFDSPFFDKFQGASWAAPRETSRSDQWQARVTATTTSSSSATSSSSSSSSLFTRGAETNDPWESSRDDGNPPPSQTRSRAQPSSEQLKEHGNDLFKQEDYAMAIRLYTSAIDQNDGTADLAVLYGNRAAAHLQIPALENIDAAIADCRTSLDIHPTSKVVSRLASAQLRRGYVEEAVRTYELGLHLPPTTGIDLAAEHEQAQRLCQSISVVKRCWRQWVCEPWVMDVLQKGLEMAPLAHRYRLFLILALIVRSEFPSATAHWNYLIKHSKNGDSVMFHYIQLMMGLYCNPKDAKDADLLGDLSWFNNIEARSSPPPDVTGEQAARLLKEAKTFFAAQNDGNRLYSAEKYGEAVSTYTKGLDQLKSSPCRYARAVLFCNRAAAFKELGEVSKAISDCNEAIVCKNDFASAFARRARCYQASKDYEKAVEDFQRACEFDNSPKHQEEHRHAQKLLDEAKAKRNNYYIILGVSRTADLPAIKKAFRELALTCHPDKITSDAEKENAIQKFKQINEAYQVLSSAELRRKYDLSLKKDDHAWSYRPDREFSADMFNAHMFSKMFSTNNYGFSWS